MNKYINVSNSIKINHILRNVDLADYMNANTGWFTVGSREICIGRIQIRELGMTFYLSSPSLCVAPNL